MLKHLVFEKENISDKKRMKNCEKIILVTQKYPLLITASAPV